MSMTAQPLYPDAPEPFGVRLTPRQQLFWTLLASGLSNNAIAYQLGLSPKWVENAMSELYQVLCIDTSCSRYNPRVKAALLFHQVQWPGPTGSELRA